MRRPAAPEPLIWDQAEILPPEELAALQLDRLRAVIARVLASQPPGAQRLTTTGITGPADVRGLQDLPRLPFSTKSDLRAHYPFGLLAVPREDLVRVQASSGS